jgi:hypothetical protein
MTGFLEIEYFPGKVGGGGQRYRVDHGGETLLESCKDPFHDGARALLNLGVDVDDILVMSEGKSHMVCMRGRIGNAAAGAVSEGEMHGPRFTKWAPYTGPAPKED